MVTDDDFSIKWNTVFVHPIWKVTGYSIKERIEDSIFLIILAFISLKGGNK